MGLIPFDEATRRLHLSNRSYLGLRGISIKQIVGSVGRSHEVDRSFRSHRGLSPSRLDSLRIAFAEGGMPAIDVFEVGDAYFVEDGHHRVVVAREQGAEFIDARVTRLITDYRIGPDVDVCQLIHTEQQRLLLDETGLGRARPDAVIEFTLLRGYPELCEIVKAHGYDLARRRGALPTREEVAADWYDGTYRSGVAAAHRASLPDLYASWNSTDADQFLWLYQIRRDLRAHDSSVQFDRAAAYARTLHLSRQQKRQHLHDGNRPLRRRED